MDNSYGNSYDIDGSSGVWSHQSDSPHPHIRAHDEKRLHRRIFYRSSGRRVCFPLCDPGNGCPAGACCGAGAECLVGRFAYGALCGGSQCASGRNGDRLQLCGPGNKKSQICRRGSMAQKNTGRCDPGFWYSADLCRKIADYYCI